MESESTEIPVSDSSAPLPSIEVLRKKNLMVQPKSDLFNAQCGSSFTTNHSNNRASQSFIDASLSEEQLLAIIDQQASMANKDPGKSPDEILRMIDENCSFISNQTNQEELANIGAFSSLQNVGPSSFPGIAGYQNNFMPNFPNMPVSSSYLPYFPMNFYHHQILMDQAAHQVAQQATFFNKNVAGRAQFDYSQNLDNYIETVFEDQHDQNQSNSVYMDYGQTYPVPIESKQMNRIQISKDNNGIPSNNQASEEHPYKISVQFKNDSEIVHKPQASLPPQTSKYQIQQNRPFQHDVISESPKSNQFYSNTSQKISKPLPIKPGFNPFHSCMKPTGSIKKIGAMTSFPLNTTLIPYQQPNVYLISNEANTMPKQSNNFQYMVSPPKISIRPPLRTKRSIIKEEPISTCASQESSNIFQNTTYSYVKDDYISKMDFSSLDTSDIVISKIVRPEVPLHKNRKQQLVHLKDCDITYKMSESSRNSEEEPFTENNLSDQNIAQQESLSEKDSGKDSEKDSEKESETVGLSKLNSSKSDEVYKKKSSRKSLRKLISKHLVSSFNTYSDDDEHDDDLYRDDDSSANKISSKSLKCSVCMKIFKSSQTLSKHRKQHPPDDRSSVNEKKVSDTSVSEAELAKKPLPSCVNITEPALNKKDDVKIDEDTEVENSLAELFEEKVCKIEEEGSQYINLNNNEPDYGDNNDDSFKPEDRVEASLAVLFSEGPSKREFEKFSFEKCSAIETNEINKLNMLQSSLNKDCRNEKLSNKRKKNALIPADQEINFKKDESCDDLLETLTPKQKIKSTKKASQLQQKMLKIELSKTSVAQDSGSSLVQKDNAKNLKKIRIIKKQKSENDVEETNNQKRKTRSQTKRKNETEVGTNKRKK